MALWRILTKPTLEVLFNNPSLQRNSEVLQARINQCLVMMLLILIPFSLNHNLEALLVRICQHLATPLLILILLLLPHTSEVLLDRIRESLAILVHTPILL